MPAPTYSAGSALLSAVSLAAGKNAAALFDFSTVIQGMVWCQMETGSANAPTVGTTFSMYRAVGSTASGYTTLSGSAASAQTSIPVNAVTNMQKGTTLAIINQSTKVGELVTISSISGSTITAAANLINSYTSGALVFLLEDTPSGGANTPGSSWAINKSYGTTLYPPVGVWVLQALNGDASYAVTVTALADTVPTIQ